MTLSKDLLYVVVGASNDPEKYGYKILEDLVSRGFNVIPVNLKERRIQGIMVSRSLSEISQKIDVVITVVPPSVTERIIRQANGLDISTIWMQPGSGSDKAIELCEEYGMECISTGCVLKE